MSPSIITSNWFRFSFPLLLAAVLGFGMNNVISVTQANLGIAMNLPTVLFLTAIILGHTFNQSRCSMVALAMLITYSLIQYRLQTSLSTGTTLLELSLMSVLLPIACLLTYAFKDSNILTRTFIYYCAVLLMFIAWSYLILQHFASGGFDNFIDDLLFSVPQVSKLPFVLVLYLIALSGITAILVLKNNRIADVVVYSAIVTASCTFIFFHVPYVSSTMFSLSGVLLLVYLVSASHELAFNDSLTGIPGRHALEMDLKHLGRKYSIAMLDVDHFKSFNDTYGHDTGDDVLKLVASRLALITGRAKVYRYGGEEFTAIFKGKYVDEVLDHLELLRVDIEEYEMSLRNIASRPKSDVDGTKKRGKAKKTDTVNITISIGVADSTTDNKPESVIKAADKALYKAKQTGRNKVAY
ncbi:diguanylate cyclase [Vibrio sp. SCSIO 43135]|uniref:diguanylate cyclase n=1 Tax=Vibrio paucivorans TaxID=2829489 RepID=A0A9X3HUJ5_9VIBR|nr:MULTISPECIES: diguanylate cyclase [Vibrio]MCW8336658.1 diguanylate cyclase [Vibrio paucivorans]USD44044.1 diguanylate cyclase [Vibrio sp. SCSIO 43135]